MIIEKDVIDKEKNLSICKCCERTVKNSLYTSCQIASENYTYCPAVDDLLGKSLYVPREK
jgi:hypothetical protein